MRNLILFCCLLIPWPAAARQAVKYNDTPKHHIPDSQSLVIQHLSAERNADSLRKLTLEQQVSRLSSADNLKKAVLLHQLDSIKGRDSAKMATQRRQVDSLRRITKGYPVILLKDTLMMIYARQGSFTAAERAQAVANRLQKLGDDRLFNPDNLKVTSSEQNVDIMYQDELILSVSTIDAIWQNMDKPHLAEWYRQRMIKGVKHYQQETRWQTVAKESLLALLAIVATILLIWLTSRLFRRLKQWVSTASKGWLGGLRIGDYQLLDKTNAQRTLFLLLNVVKWVLILLIVYIAMPVVFDIFPFTRDLSATLLGYVASPLRKIGGDIWNYVPNLITIIILVVVFRYILKFFHFLKTEIEQGNLRIGGFDTDWANPTYQIARVLVLAFMLVVIFPYLPGSDSPVFKGISVFLGVLFTFGSAGALSNVVAGLVLTYMRAFKLGDRVKIGEVVGDVTQKTLLVTRIRTIKNEIISIPNSTVMGTHTINFSSEAQESGLILHTKVSIGYDAPWRQVHQLLISAALETDLIEKDPAPFVFQTSLDDFYVSYQINAYTKQANSQASIYSELHSRIQDQFNKAGVEIMSPHYRSLRDGNAPAMPGNAGD